MRMTTVMTAALLAIAIPAQAQSPLIEEMRKVGQAVSGIPLPEAAASLLGGTGGDVVLHASSNQVLIFDQAGRLADYGRPVQDPGGELLVVGYNSGRRVVASPAALLRAIGPLPIPGEQIDAASCLDRLAASAGTVTAGIGPLRPGWRLEPNRHGRAIVAGARRAGIWAPQGTGIQLQTADGTSTLPCSDIVAALAEAPPTAAEAARVLTQLILILEDGNTALDRLAEYQAGLAALGASSTAEAQAARLPVADCRQLATLAVICDRLPATFRPR